MLISRATKYKIGYFIAFAVLGGLALYIYYLSNRNLLSLLLIAGFLFIPGRIQGMIYREHFSGRKLMTLGKFKEAKKCFEVFREKLDNKRWLKHGVWLAGFIYTKSIKAMTLNNIGVCELESGNIDEARTKFESALKIDTEYSIPYFNLSIISELSGERNLSIQQLNRSIELGYAQTSIDQVINKAQEIYAKIEGRLNIDA